MENRLRILAVDDNIINLATIEQELNGKYEVITVNSGKRAIKYLSKEKPDLILLDIQMALMDGIETLREIRAMEKGASIPVIMLTSQKDKDTVLEGTKLGILDYVLKPFDAQDLHIRIDKALKRAGTLPVGDRELLELARSAREELQAGNTRNATAKLEEILSYKIDEELFGRVQNARLRLRSGDTENGLRLILRVIRMLERTAKTEEDSRTRLSLSAGDLHAKLLYVLNDLQNFSVKDAVGKLDDLLSYDIPYWVAEACEEARDRLEEFDDGAAEELIKKVLQEQQNQVM